MTPRAALLEILGLIRNHFKSNNKIFKPSVAFTGGEPLLRADFLSAVLPELKKAGVKVYLETNGILFKEYARVSGYVDVVAMDIKLMPDCKNSSLALHRQFLKACRKKAFVKIVLTDKTARAEFVKALSLIAGISKKVSLVLQPATGQNGRLGIKPARLYEFTRLAREKLNNVYVLPQMHKIWNIR